jgi:hypothetical protein
MLLNLYKKTWTKGLEVEKFDEHQVRAAHETFQQTGIPCPREPAAGIWSLSRGSEREETNAPPE